MSSPYFSFIIPVYNTEAYIDRCIQSCIQQTYENIEIIIIDDCGQDNAIQIAKEYKNKDARIKIIENTNNLGTFLARIKGIKNAHGRYCLFLDSDDFVEKETCEVLYQKIELDFLKTSQYADIVCFGMKFYPKTLKRFPPTLITKTLNNENIIKSFFLSTSTPPWHLWGKVYQTKLLHKSISNISCKKQNAKLTLGEDAIQNFLIMLKAKKSIGIKECLYNYADTLSSITRKTDKKSIQTKIFKTQQAIQFLENIYQEIDHPFFSQAKQKIIEILKSHIELEKRHDETNLFAYPKSCFQSLKYHKTWKTYIRIAIYLITFGKIKL